MGDVYVDIHLMSDDVQIPKYSKTGDAGMDLRSNEDVIIHPGETRIIKTGIQVELPPGYAFEVSPRSGITAKTKLRVILGTIDSGYRGEIGIIVDNISNPYIGQDDDRIPYPRTIDDNDPNFHGDYHIRKGDRIAQLKLKVVPRCLWGIKDHLSDSDRGTGGFGHTGTN